VSSFWHYIQTIPHCCRSNKISVRKREPSLIEAFRSPIFPHPLSGLALSVRARTNLYTVCTLHHFQATMGSGRFKSAPSIIFMARLLHPVDHLRHNFEHQPVDVSECDVPSSSFNQRSQTCSSFWWLVTPHALDSEDCST
jgi:hypothetical protein